MNKKEEHRIDLDSASAQELLERVRRDISELREQYHIRPEEVVDFAYEKPDYNFIPISAFAGASPLESVVKYLKDDAGLSFNEISKILNRNYRTIWTTYSNCCKKKTVSKKSAEEPKILRKLKFVSKDEILLPVGIFRHRKLSVLESAVSFLKDQKQMKNHQIAVLLNKDDRTIWTVSSRAKAKLNGKRKH